MTRLRRALFTLTFLGLTALIPHSSVLAGQPVDPNTLNPSPYEISPPGATITCESTGQGTTCRGSVDFNFIVDSGLNCAGVDLQMTNIGSGDLSMWYDQSGSITKLINHWSKPAALGNAILDPATGQSVPWSARYNFMVTFPDPGEFDTAVRTTDGRLDSVVLPGGGLLIHDAGTRVIGPDGLIKQGGASDVFTALVSNSGVLPALCAALGA